MGYLGMRSSKSKLEANVRWRTRGQFWKLNQVQFFRDQNERQQIRSLLFNARACDRTGSRGGIRQSGNRPLWPCHIIAYRTSICQRLKNITHTLIFAGIHIRYGYIRHGLYTFQARSHTVAYTGIRRGRNLF